MIFDLATGGFDLLYRHEMANLFEVLPAILSGFAVAALVVAALLILVLGKLFRRSCPAHFSPRGFTVLVCLLMQGGLAAWIAGAGFPHFQRRSPVL
jgi:hypothetical protein